MSMDLKPARERPKIQEQPTRRGTLPFDKLTVPSRVEGQRAPTEEPTLEPVFGRAVRERPLPFATNNWRGQ